MANRVALLLSVGASIRALHIPTRWPALQPPPRPPTRCEPPTLGAGKKTSFEEYTISGEGSHIFPLPAERAAVKAAKKFRGKGAPAAKAPPGTLETVFPGLDRTYPGLRVHHLDPLVLVADGFLSDDECDAYRALAGGESAHELSQSATFSSLTASGRTSTTWYVTYAAAHPPNRVPHRLAEHKAEASGCAPQILFSLLGTSGGLQLLEMDPRGIRSFPGSD